MGPSILSLLALSIGGVSGSKSDHLVLFNACLLYTSSYGRDCHNNNINKLLYQRSLAGMTQQQVADAAGMNIRQIQKFESGERDLGNMTLRNALSLAKALDCEVDDLI